MNLTTFFVLVFINVLLQIFIFQPLRDRQKQKEEKRQKQINQTLPSTPTTLAKKSIVKKKKKRQLNSSERNDNQVLYTLKSETNKKRLTTQESKKRKSNQNFSANKVISISSKNHLHKQSIPNSFDLKGKTILIVGGEEQYFKELESELNINIVHLNGKRKRDRPTTVNGIDLICFYIQECSHSAVEITKDIAKKEGIPFCFFQGRREGLKNKLWYQFKGEINNG